MLLSIFPIPSGLIIGMFPSPLLLVIRMFLSPFLDILAHTNLTDGFQPLAIPMKELSRGRIFLPAFGASLALGNFGGII